MPPILQDKWIKVTDSLPEPWQVVWIYWQGREVLLGCRIDERQEYEPNEGWYSFEDEKCRWTDYWMPINSYTYDKPYAPNQENNE